MKKFILLMRLMRKYNVKMTYENVSGVLNDLSAYPDEYDFLESSVIVQSKLF